MKREKRIYCGAICGDYLCVPDSVQDVGNWDKNLHWSEDSDILVYWATDRQKERQRGEIKKNKTVSMQVQLFHELNIRRRDSGSFRQSTHKPPGAVCVAGLAVDQNREHPLGCKSSKLLVKLELTTVRMLQTSTPMDSHNELLYSRTLLISKISG